MGLQMVLATLRKNSQFLAGGGAVGLSLLAYYPHTLGLSKYKEVMQMCRDGEPVPVDADSLRLGQQVFDTVLWEPYVEANVNFFTVQGQDAVHKGSTFLRSGGLVGVPVNFRYRSTKEVETDKITLNDVKIDWSSPAGQHLLDSLVMSEKARQFAIARELFYLNTFFVHMQVIFIAGSIFVGYWMGAAVNALYEITRRLRSGPRALIYSFFAGVSGVIYCIANNAYGWYRDKRVDRKAAGLGLDYAEGGVEYYSKLLQRNIALRTLMGPDGAKRYTAYGNDIHFWSSPAVPLTVRKDLLVDMVKLKRESAQAQPQ